jgi:HK97 family phage major capsid protein
MTTLVEAKLEMKTLSLKAQEMVDDYEAGKIPTAELKTALDKIEPDIKKWSDEISTLTRFEEVRKSFAEETGGTDAGGAGVDANRVFKSVGRQFVESDGYKALIEGGLKGGSWKSPEIELKTTLTEGTTGVPGPGFAFVQTPTVLPGIVDIKFRQLVVADLFPQGSTQSPLLRYLVETAVTNAAAATPEGGLKPESALTFSKVDETLHKITTFLPISDEMLEDYEQIMSYLDARLTLFVKLGEENNLLSGDGTGANMVGLLNRSGLATSITKGTAPSTVDDNDMDAIYRQITAIRTTAFLEPDAVVIDPLAWQNIVLSKATGTGNYFAGGPFMDTVTPMLWGKRVVMTPAMPSLTALVGAFSQGAQIFRKGGIVVEASNSHADFFQRNQTAIRAEERVLLAVYRPGAFGTVTDL